MKDVVACEMLSGSWQTSFDPEMSEWGNPLLTAVSLSEYIGYMKQTRGIETSQYPEE